MKIVTLILIMVAMWAAGLTAFAGRVQRSTPVHAPQDADGIVVLTGGSSLRLVEAMRLLEMGKARRLLVSGVNPQASRADILTVSKAVRPLYDCCVDLGFQAADTVGNARETAAWAKAKSYHRLIVVTADFHMPRAMIEIHAALPGVTLDPYPVATGTLDARRWWKTQAGARRMILEYNKYLAVFSREAVLSLLRPGALMERLRSLLFAVWFLGGSTVLAILYLPSLILPRDVLRLLVRFWGFYVALGLRLLCDIRIEVRGREYMPSGAALIAAKHQSMLDVTAAFTVLADSCFVMKQELLKIPLFGWYCLKVGMIPLDRAGSTAALKKMVADVQARFADNRQVVIFPEGTRIPPGQTGAYKPGIAALYRELNVPCHLVATNSGVHWVKGGARPPGLVVFEFLPPIPAGLKRGEFMREVQERIETASARLLERPMGN